VKKRKFDIEALVIIIVCGILILLSSTIFHPEIYIPIRKPIGVWYAQTVRAYQRDRNSWYGPLLTPVKREQKVLQAEINFYVRYINDLQTETNLSSSQHADLIIYKSNLCVATELINNTNALKIHLKANNRDRRAPWRPWLLQISMLTLIFGILFGTFLFGLIRFIRGLIGYKIK